MPGLYLDNCVARQVAHRLNAAGYDVVTAAELGLRSAPDGRQLLVATQQNRVLVSHNASHFELLHDAWHRWSQAWGTPVQHAGILVLQHARPEMEARYIGEIMASGWPLANELYRWRVHGGWVRHQLS